MHKVLNLHNWMIGLPEDIQAKVQFHFVTHKYSKGEFVFRTGDQPDFCLQVLSGRLKVCNYSVTGQEMVHTHLVKGDCVGDWSLILDEPRMNAVISCGNTEVNLLSKLHFERLYNTHPEIPKAINVAMAQRLRLMFMLAEDAGLLPLRQRLARAIIRIAYGLGHKISNEQIVIDNVSQEELAAMVSSARPSVGRELKVLVEEGSIETQYGKITINNFTDFVKRYDNLLSVEPIVKDNLNV